MGEGNHCYKVPAKMAKNALGGVHQHRNTQASKHHTVSAADIRKGTISGTHRGRLGRTGLRQVFEVHIELRDLGDDRAHHDAPIQVINIEPRGEHMAVIS